MLFNQPKLMDEESSTKRETAPITGSGGATLKGKRSAKTVFTSNPHSAAEVWCTWIEPQNAYGVRI